jgi:hypothetical protein
MKLVTICTSVLSIFLGLVNPVIASEPLPLNIRPSVIEDDLGLKSHFKVDFQNPNTKSVYCKTAYLRAYIGPDSSPDECLRDFYELKTLDIGAFELGPNGSTASSKTVSELGKTELESFRKDRTDSSNIEYCARELPTLECGFNCPSGAKFDSRTVKEVKKGGGEVTYYCNSKGEELPQTETLKCRDNYAPNLASVECEIQCESKYKRNELTNTCEPKGCGTGRPNGSLWPEPTRNGTIEYTCDYGDPKFSSLKCNEPTEWYQPAGTSCDKKNRVFRLRPGQPNVFSNCASNSPNGAFMSAVNCKRDQAIFFGPYIDVPFGGQYRVTFHLGNIRNFLAGDPNTEVFLVDVVTPGKTHARRVIKQSDLVNYPYRADRFTVLNYYGFNSSFEDTRIETSGQLKPDPSSPEPKRNADRWVQFSLDFTILEAASGLETRVWTKNGVVNVAGVDIEFVPYQ